MKQNAIISPIISEKSMSDSGFGKFTFKVVKDSDKIQIKKDVENKYKVNVVSVATMTVKGKKRRFGERRTEVTSSPWKKAVVKLKTGQKIEVFDVSGKEKVNYEKT